MKTDHQNSVDYIRSLFLICPECDGECYVDKIGKDYFIVKCQCTSWKVGFRISEI